jgi:uridine phosphorylase
MLPILKVSAEELPKRALVVGDPARAERVAARLDGMRELGRNREYVTFRGAHRGIDLVVASHGVGAAGAAICFEELCRGGVRTIIRAGTAGGMQPEVVDGDLVIATAAVRNEGYTSHVVPLAFPAAASVDVTVALRATALGMGVKAVEGVVLTTAIFYSHDVLGSDLASWQKAGVVAVEMECAALFVVAAQHRVRAGAILTIDGNPLRQIEEGTSGYDPYRNVVTDAVERMIEVALDALVK